ncbi:MAG: histidine phosphatase family protein [bacterium]|nr:histidine phosphatase family protein [bacterium]
MKVYLIRHGETNWNLEKRIQAPDSSHLTQKGKEQALRWKKHFIENNMALDIIFSSNTLRTIETLALIFPQYKNMPNVKIDNRLNERYHTDLIGKNKEDIERELGLILPGRLSHHLYFRGTNKSLLTGKFPQEETMESVGKRVISFGEEMKKLPYKSKVLLIGHSIFNRYIVEYLTYATIGEIMPHEKQDNDELILLDIDEDCKVVEK